jgi:hypothetical protein
MRIHPGDGAVGFGNALPWLCVDYLIRQLLHRPGSSTMHGPSIPQEPACAPS